MTSVYPTRIDKGSHYFPGYTLQPKWEEQSIAADTCTKECGIQHSGQFIWRSEARILGMIWIFLAPKDGENYNKLMR